MENKLTNQGNIRVKGYIFVFFKNKIHLVLQSPILDQLKYKDQIYFFQENGLLAKKLISFPDKNIIINQLFPD